MGSAMAGRHVIAPSRIAIEAAVDCSDAMLETSLALGGLERLTWSARRRGEPVTVGVPFPSGALHSPADLRLRQADGSPAVLQARALDRWPDDSIRWALLDLRVDVADGRVAPCTLRVEPGGLSPPSELHVASTAAGVDVFTSRATFRFLKGGAFPVSDVVVGAASPFEP